MPRPKKRTIVNPNETAKLKRQIIEKVLSNNKKNGGSTSANLGALVDGWLELESDPGTFSLLIEDLGCFGAQVDEIYDLEQKFDGPVYGFIFLFKWLNNHHQNHQSDRSSRQQIKLANTAEQTTSQHQQLEQAALPAPQNDSTYATRSSTSGSNGQSATAESRPKHQNHHVVNDSTTNTEIFFAKQMISNSCATHALISVLLNCDRDELELGPTLTHLREYTKVMAPEDKGYAIGNLPLIAKAHNSHASYSSLYCRDRPNQQRGLSFAIRGNQRTNLQQNQPETYHFVSYVPIKNRLYELDGLKNNPIDHGPLSPNENWTEKFRRVIKQRLLDDKSGGDTDAMNEIRFNLMAVVPDKRVQLKSHATKLKRHLATTKDTIRKLEKSILSGNDTSYKTKSTSCNDDYTTRSYPNPASSPTSNGTLTASETGSLCAESPKHFHEGDIGDMEIPNPPYSPLSNDTLSASETGSVYNSPSRYEDSFLLDEKDHADKYFFIRFDPKSEVKDNSTDNDPTIKDETNRNNILLDRVKEQRLAAIADMKGLSRQIEREIETNRALLEEENDKRRKYKVDNSRRTHNYEPFIMTFLSMLATKGNLADLIEKDLGINRSGGPEVAAPALPSQPVAKPATKTRRQQTQQSAKPFKVPTPVPPLQPKATNNNNKTKQEPQEEPQEEEQEQERPRTSLSGRPIRATKSKYISTGRPRGRPPKNSP